MFLGPGIYVIQLITPPHSSLPETVYSIHVYEIELG